MADEKTQKGADAPKPPGDDGQPLKAKPLTISQQVLIWSLILVVGVLFGMGTSVGVLQETQADIGGVTQREILLRQGVDRRLAQALSYPGLVGSSEMYARRVKLARVAAAQGLMPDGDALEKLVDDFLARPTPTGGRTVREVLVEARGGDKEVTRAELKRKIAEEAAATAYQRRHLITPAVPLAAGESLSMVFQDQVPVLETALDASRFVQPVDDNDPELQQAYDRLRSQGRFVRPESVRLTIAHADLAALTTQAKAAVTDEQAKAYYEAHKLDPDFLKPAPPTPPASATAAAAPATPPAPESRPFDEMKPVIADRLAAEQAAKRARAAADALDAEVEAADGQLDLATFKAAAAKVGLQVVEAWVESPAKQDQGPRLLTIPALGTMRDESQLFAKDKEPGFISRVVPIQGAAGSIPSVLRLESRDSGGFRPLPDVKADVVRHLQGQRTYATFLAEATKAREQSQRVGLAAWVASADGQAWKATTAPGSYAASAELAAPSAEVGGTAGDPVVAASLAMPARPVALLSAPAENDLPRMKLVQATGYTPAPAIPDVAMRARYADGYREQLTQYRQRLFEPELRRLIEEE